MRFGPPVRFARRPDGHNLAYQVLGDAELDLVFLLGYATHLGLLWEEPSVAGFLHKLAAFSRLILLDRLGSGLSDRGPPTRPLRKTWTTSPWCWTASTLSGPRCSAARWAGGWRCCSPPPTRSAPRRWSPSRPIRPACATRTTPGAPARTNASSCWRASGV